MSQVPVWYAGGAEVVVTGALEVVFGGAVLTSMCVVEPSSQ